MKKRISIDTLMNQTLGFNTKSFSESKTTISLNKKFNYGEVGNALLTFKSDKYAMIAEAATLKADLTMMRARGENSITDKIKNAGKAIVDAVIKLFQAFKDIVKNFLVKHNDSQKKMHMLAKELLVMEDKHKDEELISWGKCKAAEKKGVKITVIGDTGVNGKLNYADFGLVRYPETNRLGDVAESIYSIEKKGINSFLDELVPNGSDDSISEAEYDAKLKDLLSSEINEIKEDMNKVKKAGLNLKTFPFREGIDPLMWLLEDLLNIANVVIGRNFSNEIKHLDKNLGEILKTLNAYRREINGDGSVTTVSDKNMNKTRLSLHVISRYFIVYLDASNLSNENLIRCMRMVIATIKPISK